MLEVLGEPLAIVLIGLTGGLVLGLAARLAGFCTLGMIEDVHYGENTGRVYLWLAALGIAIFLNHALHHLGYLDLGRVVYLQNSYTIAGAIIGGLIFGYGMAQAGNCGFTALARFGGGDLRAMVIALVMGVAALIALSGILAPLRVLFFDATPAHGTPTSLAFLTGDLVAPSVLGMALGLTVFLIAIVKTPKAQLLRNTFWGMAVGAAVTWGFFGAYWVGQNGWQAWPVVSQTFAASIGDTIHYAMFSSGLAAKFGIGSVIGVIAGGFLGSLIKGGFRWEACEDPRELKRQLFGAVLMGFGAVLAAGCSIGQGLSAMSSLSITAPLVAAAIWLGAWVGLRQLILGFEAET